MRRCIAFFVCGIATLVLSVTAAGADGAYNNLVQLDNNNAATPSVSTASMVSHDATSDPVENANLAYSHSFNCTGCRTVTVALQAVIIEANPTTIAPQNAAVAVNENCTSCFTFAYAHQYVFSPHHQIRLDGETRDRLATIQRYIDQVAHSNTDFATMSSQLDKLSWGFCYVVQQAVQSEHEGGNSASPNACGAAPFDHRQVEERG